jgi:hypothetical protein
LAEAGRFIGTKLKAFSFPLARISALSILLHALPHQYVLPSRYLLLGDMISV